MEWHHALGLSRPSCSSTSTAGRARALRARRVRHPVRLRPLGWQEIEGIHNRGDFDLGRHQEFSGKKLEYFDQADERALLPYVVETSAGADRATLAVLVNAYREETVEGETRRRCSGFHPAVAPIKAGVFPLVKKDGMPELATALVSRPARALPGVLRRQRRDRPALPPAGRGRHAVLHHGRRRHDGGSGP